MNAGIEFDHRPCLAERRYDAERDETIPAANDPNFIIALTAPAHHSISGDDNVRMKKVARLRRREREFREALVRKQPGQKRVRKKARELGDAINRINHYHPAAEKPLCRPSR
jgi:hypothetical protein